MLVFLPNSPSSTQAVNNAGLTAVASSQLVIFDTTPPVAGRVFDGPRPASGFWDLDYTSNHTHVRAHWEPFLDIHSVVTEYQWGIGMCPGCTDVLSFISIGLRKGAVNQSYGTQHVIAKNK